MLRFILIIISLQFLFANEQNNIYAEVQNFTAALEKSTTFFDQHYDEINFDGLLGLVLAEANLLQITNGEKVNDEIEEFINSLINKIKRIKQKIIKYLTIPSSRYILFCYYFLRPTFWYHNVDFIQPNLTFDGIYNKADFENILNQQSVIFKGIRSDSCIEELLLNAVPTKYYSRVCYVSSICNQMMFEDRVDFSYFLTHRLFFLQIIRGLKCIVNKTEFQKLINNYCSRIFKEAKTNEYYGFPQHDLFLEQVIFCGSEGFSQFFISDWRKTIMSWQTSEGCFKNRGENYNKTLEIRSENKISYGCTDHTTGLGAAALALNLRYLLKYL